jgi:hypothetical protein
VAALFYALRFFELARVFVRINHITRLIVNTNHRIMWAVKKLASAIRLCAESRFLLSRAAGLYEPVYEMTSAPEVFGV